jgi:hypothetical protein
VRLGDLPGDGQPEATAIVVVLRTTPGTLEDARW